MRETCGRGPSVPLLQRPALMGSRHARVLVLSPITDTQRPSGRSRPGASPRIGTGILSPRYVGALAHGAGARHGMPHTPARVGRASRATASRRLHGSVGVWECGGARGVVGVAHTTHPLRQRQRCAGRGTRHAARDTQGDYAKNSLMYAQQYGSSSKYPDQRDKPRYAGRCQTSTGSPAGAFLLSRARPHPRASVRVVWPNTKSPLAMLGRQGARETNSAMHMGMTIRSRGNPEVLCIAAQLVRLFTRGGGVNAEDGVAACRRTWRCWFDVMRGAVLCTSLLGGRKGRGLSTDRVARVLTPC